MNTSVTKGLRVAVHGRVVLCQPQTEALLHPAPVSLYLFPPLSSNELPSKAMDFFCALLANTSSAGARMVGPPDQNGLGCVVLGAGRAARWSHVGKDSSWDGDGGSLLTRDPMQALLLQTEGEISLEQSPTGMLMPKGDA